MTNPTPAQASVEACAKIADAMAANAADRAYRGAKSRTGRDKANAAAQMARDIAQAIRALSPPPTVGAEDEAVADRFVLVPKEPSDGLLMSMAIRRDHGLGVPGYYDMLGEGEHAKRLRVAITEARQAYEEVVGSGFYSEQREADYVALRSCIVSEKGGV